MQGPLNRGWRVAVCLASGGSMDAEQATMVATAQRADLCNSIAINTTWKLHPGADVLYACDAPWWSEYIGELRTAGVRSEFWAHDRRLDGSTRIRDARRDTPRPPPTIPGGEKIHWIRTVKEPGLTTRCDTLHSGGNGGYQAINLAYLFGARRIVLVGFDMKLGPSGAAHWHADHPKPLAQAKPFGTWIPRFDQLAADLKAAGVEVLNAARNTALSCFPRCSLEHALGP